jgi:hypothetical protein
MLNHIVRTTVARVCASIVAAWLAQVITASAAPVTLYREVRLNHVCDFAGNCTPLNELWPFTITYDPSSIVVNELSLDYGWQMFVLSLQIDVPFTPVPNPFGGPVSATGDGNAFFPTGGGIVSGGDVEIRSALVAGDHVCSPSNICSGGEWSTSTSIINSANLPPHPGPPTAADFEALLLRGDLTFITQAFFDDPISLTRTYVPGSRVYLGQVIPEPPEIALLALGGGFALFRRWQQRSARQRRFVRRGVGIG